LDLPFLETRSKDLEEIFNVLTTKFALRKNSNQRFLDLGSGNGIVVIFAAMIYNINSIGLEINDQLIEESKNKITRLQISKNKIMFLNEDFYSHSLNSYDFIYTYSLPTMHKFMKHIFKTVKSEAIIISYKYPLSNYEDILNLVYKLELEDVKEKRNAFFYEKIK
jgi:SAM-dependent methyltransferase